MRRMLMKISCIQMDMRLGAADENFAHAEALIREAVTREGGRVLQHGLCL